MKISWKAGLPLLTLTALLASCTQTPDTSSTSGTLPQPQPEVLAAPAEPVASADTDLAQAQSVTARAQTQAQSLLTKETLTPDLYDALGGLGLLDIFSAGTQPPMPAPTPVPYMGLKLQSFSPTTLGRSLLGRRGTQSTLNIQSTIFQPDTLLPTGTQEIDAQGRLISVSAQPLGALVLINGRSGTTLKAEWKVGDAATTFLPLSYQALNGDINITRQELPTNARITVTKTSTAKTVASAEFTMTPGECLGVSGPDALGLNIWAGTVAAPELKASAAYAWNAQGVSLNASASLSSRKGDAGADLKLAALGITTDRCDLSKLSFTPTRLDASASASLPGDSLNAELKVRDLGNVVFSSDALKVKNPFAGVKGTLQASARHNNQPFFSAFGPLADGADLDLQPGDGVVVRFVKGNTVVTTNLQSLF